MLAWLGISPEDATNSDEEEERQHLVAHKLLMKTLSECELQKTPKVANVWSYDGQQKAISGTLCLTGHHMILYADETQHGEVWILYKNIDSIEKRIGVDKGTLVIKCKDLKQIQLTIPGVEDASNVAYSAEILSSITDPCLHFPYFFRAKFHFDEDGWDLYNINERFAEMNTKADRWRISEVNSEFAACQSYPRRVIVPKDIDDHALQKSTRFRHLGRFPVLSYFHKNGAAILRSSQPLLGTGNRRCKEDEKLINAMLGPSHRGYILDLRSVQSATQAKSKGGGYETEHHYPRWKRMHMNLHSYYVQQESLIRLVEASNDKSGSMDRWMSKLESSNWMEYIKRSLDASCLVAQCIDREEWSVLIHGAEGYDSTLTVTSLAQIILDPECRTIRGFLTLIDREWIHGGHPFTERSSHGPYSNAKQRGEGPVFSIFLECVFQLVCQFPLCFEFTSSLLVDVRMHSYASEFGTFLFNNMLERTRGKLRTRTVSLWSYILSPSVFDSYINPLYRGRNEVIWPSVAPQSLEFWEELFTPWLTSRNQALKRVKLYEAERMELESLISKLSKRVGDIPVNSTGTDAKILSESFNKDTNNSKDSGKIVKPTTLSNGPIPPTSTLPDKLSSKVTETSQSQFYVPINSDMTPPDFVDGPNISNGTSQSNLLEDLMAFVDTTPDPQIVDDSKMDSELQENFSDPNLIDLDELNYA